MRNKIIRCQNCERKFIQTSLKNTKYCCTRCGDYARNDRKKEIREARRRNIEILDSMHYAKNREFEIDQRMLESRGFEAKYFDKQETILKDDRVTKSIIYHFGHYQIYNSNGVLTIINH